MALCKYANLFGAPGTGLHKYRVFGLAAVDLLATLIAAWFASRWWGWRGFWGWINAFIVLFVIGEILHILFCVNTAFINTYA